MSFLSMLVFIQEQEKVIGEGFLDNSAAGIKIIGYFFVICLVLLTVFLVTKFIAAGTKKVMKGRYISIIETINLGIDKQIHLIKVENEFILVACSGKNIVYLTNLNIEDYEEDKSQQYSGFDFKSILEKYSNIFGSNKGDKNQNIKTAEEDKSKNIGVFKKNLEKLKSFTGRDKPQK